MIKRIKDISLSRSDEIDDINRMNDTGYPEQKSENQIHDHGGTPPQHRLVWLSNSDVDQ
jgi:ribonuclease HII